jgi:hypothetical protein
MLKNYSNHLFGSKDMRETVFVSVTHVDSDMQKGAVSNAKIQGLTTVLLGPIRSIAENAVQVSEEVAACLSRLNDR